MTSHMTVFVSFLISMEIKIMLYVCDVLNYVANLCMSLLI